MGTVTLCCRLFNSLPNEVVNQGSDIVVKVILCIITGVEVIHITVVPPAVTVSAISYCTPGYPRVACERDYRFVMITLVCIHTLQRRTKA